MAADAGCDGWVGESGVAARIGLAGVGVVCSRDAFYGIRDDRLLRDDGFGSILPGLVGVYFVGIFGLRRIRIGLYKCWGGWLGR